MIASKSLASWYSGVPIIETAGLTGLLSLRTFTEPYLLPELPSERS